MWNFWKEVDSEYTQRKIHCAVITQISSTLGIIDSILHRLLEEDRGQSLDCLFYPAALYVQMCQRLLSDHLNLDGAAKLILPVLSRCKKHIESRGSDLECVFGGKEYDANQGMIPFSEEWWKVLFSSDKISLSPSQTGAGLPPDHIDVEPATEAVVGVSGDKVIVATHGGTRLPQVLTEQNDAWTMDSAV